MKVLKFDFSDKEISRIASNLVNIVIPANRKGFTVEPSTLKPPAIPNCKPQDLFCVSLKEYEKIFFNDPDFENVYKWLSDHKKVWQKSDCYIGGWRADMIYYLDITILVLGKAQAFETAYLNQQVAIYHPFSGKSIPVAYEPPQAA